VCGFTESLVLHSDRLTTHERSDRSAGWYGSTAPIFNEPCREAGAPMHGKPSEVGCTLGSGTRRGGSAAVSAASSGGVSPPVWETGTGTVPEPAGGTPALRGSWKTLRSRMYIGTMNRMNRSAAILVAERPHAGSRGFQPTERNIPALPRRVATLEFMFTNAVPPIRIGSFGLLGFRRSTVAPRRWPYKNRATVG